MIDFLGIGAQKCGTTWLYEHLRGHPEVRFTAGKEVHFWDLRRKHGIEWWLSLFPNAMGIRQGEITPAYAFLKPEIIACINEAAPAIKLFYVVRNPMARAWSSALMALGRAELAIDEVSDQWFVDHFKSRGSRQRGNYSQCIRNWLAVFPPKNLHVMFLEDIRENPKVALVRLAEHIGVDPRHFFAANDSQLRTPIFTGPGLDVRSALLNQLENSTAMKSRN